MRLLFLNFWIINCDILLIILLNKNLDEELLKIWEGIFINNFSRQDAYFLLSFALLIE